MTNIPFNIVTLIQNGLIEMGHNANLNRVDWLTFDLVLDNTTFSIVFSSSKLNPKPEMPDMLSIIPYLQYAGSCEMIYFDFASCELCQFENYSKNIADKSAKIISNYELESLILL